MTTAVAYQARFRKVLAHVDAHLDGDLSLERPSEVASSSRFHFHRQFAELFGVGPHRYVQLVRLRRAAHQLAFRDDRVLEIALACGYESHEAFARAFKKVAGQMPSEFRERPGWDRWHAAFQPVTELRSLHMSATHRPEDVKVVDFPETRVAVLEHRGDPRAIGDTIRRFIDWRKQSGVRPPASATYNLFYNDPEDTPPDEFRLDLCAGIDRAVPPNDHGVVERAIPAGRCAVLRHVGSDATLGEALRYLYGVWLPASGEEPRDFPLFAQRVRMFPDVPEGEAVTDVFLPLR